MLAIRMQRTGRKGSASFRIIVQDSRFSPTSGRVVARVGHFNPHTKDKSIDIDKVVKYLEEGAQPSPRVVRLLLAEKVKMPSWVLLPDNSKKSKVKNAKKLRKNRPAGEAAPEPVAEEVKEEAKSEETPVPEEPAETVAKTEDAEPSRDTEPVNKEEPKAEEPKENSETKEAAADESDSTKSEKQEPKEEVKTEQKTEESKSKS